MLRRNKKAKDEGQSIDLPITAMLDMSFQLMAFFIFTFNPLPQEGQLPVDLPKLDEAKEQAPPDITLPEEKVPEYSIIVDSDSGEMGHIKIKSEQSTDQLKSDTKDVLSELSSKLKEIPKPDKRKPTVTIETSGNLRYSRIIDLMDTCKAAGFDSISFKVSGKEKR